MTDGSVSGSTFRNNFSNGILVNTENSSRIGADNATSGSTDGFVVSGNTFDDNNIAIQFGVFHSSDMTVDIQNNTIVNDNRTANVAVGGTSTAIVVGSSSTATAGSTLNARIESNTIGNAAIDGSGSSIGNGIRLIIQGLTDVTALINNNTIREAPIGFGIDVELLGSTSGTPPTSDVTITNNNVDHTNAGFKPGTSDFPLPAIYVSGDNQGTAGRLNVDVRGNTVPNTASFNFLGTMIELFEYTGPNGDLHLVDNPVGPGGQTASQQVAGSNTGTASASANVALDVTGALPQPPDLTPLPLMAVEPPPAEAPAGGDGKGDGTGGGFVPPTPPAEDEPPAEQPAPEPAPAPADGNAIIVDDGYLSRAELDFFVDAAIERWAATGLTAEQVAALEGLTFRIAEMSGLYLGSYDGGVITLDNDGAGRGWFADTTPLEDSEFAHAASATRLNATPGTPPAGRFDLLTTILHEMGHALGLSDLYDDASRDELLYGYLFAGERRLPGADDADGAIVGSVTSEAFAGSLIQVIPADGTGGLFNLPAGQSVTIQWDATIDLQQNQLIVNPSNQGTVSATNPPAAFPDANSNSVTTTLDTLTLGGTVWHDNGAGGGTVNNGLKDGTEAGIDGVLVALFADTGTVAGAWDASDTQLGASVTTSGGGNYSFAGLAPGEYIVRIDQDNFDTGGNVSLVNRVTTTGSADPDDNIDNDDNGAAPGGNGTPVYSSAITLAYNTEPTVAAGHRRDDTNFTLDFGFVTLNQAPVNTVPGTQTIDEDSSRTFNTVNGNLISISDADAGSGNLLVTLTIADGALVEAAGSGAVIGGSGTNTLTITGTLTQINNALNGLVYTPPAHANGSRTLTVTTNDQGNTGVDPGTSGDGSSEQDSDPITINITAINDTPVVTAASPLAVDEQVAEAIAPTGTLSDIDLDALNGGNGNYDDAVLTVARNGGSTAQDLLTIANGAGFVVNGANLETSPGSLVFATFSGGNGVSLVITFTSSGTPATSALADAVFQAIQYTHTGDTPPASIQLDVTLNDGAPANGQGSVSSNPATHTASITVNITDTVDNATPTLDLDADDSSTATGTGFAAAAFTEGDTLGVLIADADSLIADADLGDNIESATISVQAAVAGDSLVLGPQVGYVINGSGTTTITITGTGTGDDYEAIIEQIRFLNTGDNPTAFGAALTRTISSTVSDGTASSVAALTTIAINGTDDPAVANDDAFTTDEATTITGASATCSPTMARARTPTRRATRVGDRQ